MGGYYSAVYQPFPEAPFWTYAHSAQFPNGLYSSFFRLTHGCCHEQFRTLQLAIREQATSKVVSLGIGFVEYNVLQELQCNNVEY